MIIGQAMSNAGFIVLVADADMRYLAASAAACELLGYTREELLEMTVSDVVAEPDAASRYRTMRENGGQEGRITLLHKDGRRIDAEYEAHETRVARMQYYVSVLRPLAEQD